MSGRGERRNYQKPAFALVPINYYVELLIDFNGYKFAPRKNGKQSNGGGAGEGSSMLATLNGRGTKGVGGRALWNCVVAVFKVVFLPSYRSIERINCVKKTAFAIRLERALQGLSSLTADKHAQVV